MIITRIDINHIDKIEGHAGFTGLLLDGKVKQAKIEVKQGVRLIEAILQGRPYEDAPIITARICGVCPIVHWLTSIEALEKALKVKVSPATVKLRKIMMLGQWIQSHSLHAYFLSLSDFFKYKTDIQLIKKFPDLTQKILDIREFGNKLIANIEGRSIHPIASCVGGFRKSPAKEKLEELLEWQPTILKYSLAIAKLFQTLHYPKLKRKTEYIGLSSKKEYAIYGDKIISSEGLKFDPLKVNEKLKEIQYLKEPVKRVYHNTETIMPGALARIFLNNKKLNPQAKKLFLDRKSELTSYNSFYNIYAQVIEIVHCIEESEKLLNQLIRSKLDNVCSIVKPRAGRAIAAIEAPRGTLYHQYELDKNGKIVKVNLITPTAQFISNLEEDARAFIPNLRRLSKNAQRQKIRMLIRAYDPCMACSVH